MGISETIKIQKENSELYSKIHTWYMMNVLGKISDELHFDFDGLNIEIIHANDGKEIQVNKYNPDGSEADGGGGIDMTDVQGWAEGIDTNDYANFDFDKFSESIFLKVDFIYELVLS